MSHAARNAYDVVIVGGGQAGLQTVMSLVDGGYRGSVLLVSDESVHPYQRPPLSKSFLEDKLTEEALVIQAPEYFERNRVDVRLDTSAAALDRSRRRISLSTGEEIVYGRLVLAVGASARRFPEAPEGLRNVFHVRKLHEASALKDILKAAGRLVVIGGGFMGLEIAALSAVRGTRVAIVESTERLLSRSASASVSEAFGKLHQENGVVIHTHAQASTVLHDSQTAQAVVLADGEVLPADAVLVSIGVSPNISLARDAGLAVENGICVDGSLKTTDPAIYAIGDCSSFPYRHDADRPVRVESVQNALDQARAVAGDILGSPATYDQIPVFWTEQFGNRLQVAGIPLGSDRSIVRGSPEALKFSVYRFQGCRLMAVESLNAPGDHMVARKLLQQRINPTAEQVSDTSFSLKWLLAS